MRVGDVVKVKGPTPGSKTTFMGEPANVLAVVYESYNLGGSPGVSLITQNGVDLGGFSADEMRQHLEMVRNTTFSYDFKNVMQLDRDWKAGVFKEAFYAGP